MPDKKIHLGNNKSGSFYDAKNKKHLRDKIAVCLLAQCLLNEGDSIIIDAGSSLTPLARIINEYASTIEYKEQSHYSIMTHNRVAFDALINAPSDARLNLFYTGGRYDDDLKASFGWLAEYAYQNFHAKWVFLGQAGLLADEGLFCHGNTEELSLKRILFSKPGFCRVIISDANKIGVPAGLCFGESDKLINNVDHCLLLTTEPDLDKESKSRDKFEKDLRILESRYKVKVIRINLKELDETPSPSGNTNTISFSTKQLSYINGKISPIILREIKKASLEYITTKGVDFKVEKVKIETADLIEDDSDE